MGFLEGLSALAKERGALLILDEVMTGFRVSYGGAQQLYNVRPDLTTLGKIVGGGLPCAAYGGRRDVMQKIAPLGPVYQAGTLSGNPLAMAAGFATLQELREPGVYARLEEISAAVCQSILDAAAATGWSQKICLNRVGAMFTLFFCPGPVRNFADAKRADTNVYAAFFRALLNQGIYFPPSQFEAAFTNLAMDRKALKRVARAVREAFVVL
jgi:glutamate-1-semialdehyde 2,1-aminomutase